MMDEPMAAADPPRPVDGVALERARQRLERAPQAPWLHHETARRMADRLVLFKERPRRVLDWWPDAGGSRETLRAALPNAEHHELHTQLPPKTADTRFGWLSKVKRWGGRRAVGSTVGHLSAADAPLDGVAEMVWANMLLHHVREPAALLRAWHRALTVNGFLMFTTLGPGSLQALTQLYKARGWGQPMGPLVDMHDWGDLLVEAGFADPVMDQEQVTLTWSTPAQALAELRGLGANVHPHRHPGLRTPRWRQNLCEALVQTGSNEGQPGRVCLRFELVYGHAFKPAARLPLAPETRVDVDTLRAALKTASKPRS
jgi:malonyl-CoA O-methyltransferase